MTVEELKTAHLSIWLRINDIWAAMTIKDYAEFDQVFSGFQRCNWSGKFQFDDRYTRDRLLSDWRAFLSGISWCMYH